MRKNTDWIHGIGAAFAAYSRIPVPAVRWDEETIGWQIAFFPLVGVVTGLIWAAAGWGLCVIGAYPVLTGALLTALPLMFTGGIHMDGFLDTSDAIHSWKSPAERLEILKDPHIGAFALICGMVYVLLYFGFAAQLAVLVAEKGTWLPLLLMAWSHVMIRSLSGLSVIRFPKAKNTGMLRETADASSRGTGRVLAAWMILAGMGIPVLTLYFREPLVLILPAADLLVFRYYHTMSRERFGGVTGDLAGWFLQVCELVSLGVVVILTVLQSGVPAA